MNELMNDLINMHVAILAIHGEPEKTVQSTQSTPRNAGRESHEPIHFQSNHFAHLTKLSIPTSDDRRVCKYGTYHIISH